MNNQDLISRKAAIEETLKICPEKTKPGSFDEYGATVLCGVIDVILKQLPAVDAVPVTHGRWKDNGNGTISCSRCATWFPKEREPFLLFCGYCGAKMDGDQRLAFADQSGAEYTDNPTV